MIKEDIFKKCPVCGLPIFLTEHEASEAWNKRVYGG